MPRSRALQSTVALVIITCFLAVGCAELMDSPGQAALLCGAGGAAAGAAIGGAVSRDWTGALIGAAAGAIAGALSCFAFAEYKSRQVRGYRETQQETAYQPSQGDAIQITHYEITPAAAAPGSSVAFNATYTVMTPNPDADVAVTEVRSLHVYDTKTSGWRELGRVPNQVTVKPGTRQADGKFDVRSGVAEGQYRIIFQVVRGEARDTKELPLLVTRNQEALNSPQARIVQVSAPGAKPLDPAARARATAARPATEPAPPAVAPEAPARGGSLSSLGEQAPQPPSQVAGAPPAAATQRTTYFLASKIAGRGTLRAGPGPSHAVVGAIGPGERYPIVGREGTTDQPWYRIRLDSGAEAWVAGALGTEVDE